MNAQEEIFQLAISLTKGVGAVTVRRLLAAFGSLQAVFESTKKELSALDGIGEQTAELLFSSREKTLKQAENELEFCQKNGIERLFLTSENYPELLKNCEDAPIMLFSRGEMQNFNAGKFLAVVGTRNSTKYGEQVCRNLIRDLAQNFPDLVIVSGIAYGIDALAHAAALDAGAKTVAVTAHGMDTFYPMANRALAKRLLPTGAIITEYPKGTRPERTNFINRNRIVAGMCQGALIVEAAEKSGTLITARRTLDYKRELFAVPGRIFDLESAGCNRLIAEKKASPVLSWEDISKKLNWKTDGQQQIALDFSALNLDEEERKILEILKQEKIIHFQELADLAQIPTTRLNPILSRLEVKGLVLSKPGSCYSLG